MKLAYLKAWFLLVGGVVLVGTGLWFLSLGAGYVLGGERATGVVIDTVVKRVRGTRFHHPVVRYRTVEGIEMEFKERTGLWSFLFKRGQPVNVLYYPEDPSKAKIDSFWTLWLLPSLIMLLGIGSFVAGRSEYPSDS